MRLLKSSLCFATLIVGLSASAMPQPLDSIAVIVNDAIITKSELAQQIKLIEQQIKQSGHTLPENKALENQVLDHLILKEIQLQIAKKTGIQVDESMLDSAIENISKNNHMTLTQFREALAFEGIDYNHYRNNIRHQIMISQLQQRDVLHDIQVSEQEVSQFLQSPNGLGNMVTEYRISHILVPLPESPTPDEIENATQKAQHILTELRSGKDFSQLALAESKGAQALNGGDLGWRKLAELPTIFEKIIPTLSTHDIPEPIRSSSGLHLIKLLEKRNAQSSHTIIGKTLVRHILIKTNALTSDNEAKRRLNEIREKIASGEDFAQLAKAHSADMASSSNGGSLGWVSKDVLVPEFSSKMESLAIQELSEPFKTSFGWHIMQVMDRKTLNEDETALRQKAREMIQQRKYEEKLQTWARQLRDEAYVRSYLES